MELRSSTKQRNEAEYLHLQLTLTNLGFYEDGMQLQEMRHIWDALQQSVRQKETAFQEDDLEKAIHESELDFMAMQEPALNSTMINNYNAASAEPNGLHFTSSPGSSPELPPLRFTVQAEVHRSPNWSPPVDNEERLQRKRSATTQTPNTKDAETHDAESEMLAPNNKRLYHVRGAPVSIRAHGCLLNDSGVNLEEECLPSGQSLSSLHSSGNSVGSNSMASTQSLQSSDMGHHLQCSTSSAALSDQREYDDMDDDDADEYHQQHSEPSL